MTDPPRTPIVVPANEGRAYEMGRMRAIFKADENETAGRYSISEWWLEPRTRGPGTHAHTDDHIFYVIEGSLRLTLAGQTHTLNQGAYAVIPGGTPHDFKNTTTTKAGFISLNSPAGFETKMPAIADALASTDLRIDQ